MNNIRLENRLRLEFNGFKSKVRSLILFGSINKVKFGKQVHLSGKISLGNNVSIRDYSRIQGVNIIIKDNVYIHENVLIRGFKHVEIGKGTTINRNTSILDKVIIGEFCSIAPNCVIVGSNHNFKSTELLIKQQKSSFKGIIIEDDVWIGANATIVDGVSIGKGAIVAAGAVVSRNVDPYTIVGGVPAKLLSIRK